MVIGLSTVWCLETRGSSLLGKGVEPRPRSCTPHLSPRSPAAMHSGSLHTHWVVPAPLPGSPGRLKAICLVALLAGRPVLERDG